MNQRLLISSLAITLLAGSTLLLHTGCNAPTSGTSAMSGGEPDGILLRRAIERAERAGRMRDAVRAEALYRDATNIYPGFAAAWNNLGLTLMEQDRWSEADEAFALASDLAASDPRPLYNRGIVRLKRGYPEQAIPFFEDALAINPNFLPALRGGIRAEILTRSTSERTLRWLERAIMLETDDHWLSYLRLQRLQIEAEVRAKRPSWVQ